MTRWLPLGALTLCSSCGGTQPAQQPRETAALSPARPDASLTAPPAPSGSVPTSAPGPLEKRFTGQAQPSITVRNGFPTSQHLFIDWVVRGVLPPGTTQTFTLAPGTHTITSAESADPDDHPAAVTETFEAGYSYNYAVLAR